MTKATYRKKALPHLLKDFQKRCAYCLDPNDFRHPSQDQVDHFNCQLHGRKRHQYKNLMLACAACNLSKHDKPVRNPWDKKQRLLNCTEETEFPEHIVEGEDGQWSAMTPEGQYHLTCIALTERCHREKRGARRKIARQILDLCTTAIQYQSENPAETQAQLMNTIADLLHHLESFPPLVTERGVLGVREWLESQGIDTKLLGAARVAGGGQPGPD